MGVAWGIAEMEESLRTLQRLGRDPGWQPPEEPEGWLDKLQQELPDPAQFRAGKLADKVMIWERFFAAAGNDSMAARKVIKWIRNGVYTPMVGLDHPGQEKAPFRRKKLEIVRAMLRRTLPTGSDIELWLAGDKPHQVAFPNHRSTIIYADFLREEVRGMLDKKVIKEWRAADPPVVINSLLVADEKAPKLRLCLSPMYVNLFTKYQPVRYERVEDVAGLAEPGDWAFSTDDKSGYWQVPLHPAMWKYMAFRAELNPGEGERVYCFTHLPFGLAPACYVYTTIKQEIYRPLREAGIRLVFLIDDQLSLQQGACRTRCQSGAMGRLLGSLGWYLSFTKCQWEPTQSPRFLGLIADLALRAFRIPPEKERALEAQIQQLLARPHVSDRDIARVAGTVMALSPALDLAPLAARGLMKAMQGVLGWDELYPSPEAMRADLGLVLELMAKSTGRRWSLRSTIIQVVGDASETALAAFTPNGEWGAPMVIPFTSEELAAVAENRWSSTARELSVLGKMITTMEEQRPGELRGKLLQYATDSQPGMQGLMRMKGNANTFPIVREVRLLCAALDAELQVIWRPREHALQQIADDWTKVEDESDWSVHPEVVSHILADEALRGYSLGLDVFASATNSVVPTAYFSLFLGPGCLGVDAFAQAWRPHLSGEHIVAWINGPFQRMTQILRRVGAERVDCVIIAPLWSRPWAALWGGLPVRAVIRLPHRRDLFLPGALVPAAKRHPKAPRYAVSAYVVIW